MPDAELHEVVSGRELLSLLYRLARKRATGVVTAARPGTEATPLVLRRGNLVLAARQEPAEIAARLRRWSAEPRLRIRFDGGVAAYPPGARGRELRLDSWVIRFFATSLSASAAREVAARLAGARVGLREELAPEPAHLDETEQRILCCLAEPRRTDEIARIARAPRFRVLSLLFALGELDALELHGVAAPGLSDHQREARRTLGLSTDADRAQVKRAYRRLARALHPDLRPAAAPSERRGLERKLAEVNRAYRLLVRSRSDDSSTSGSTGPGSSVSIS
jgi:DnaJ-domain-containing protein 1